MHPLSRRTQTALVLILLGLATLPMTTAGAPSMSLTQAAQALRQGVEESAYRPGAPPEPKASSRQAARMLALDEQAKGAASGQLGAGLLKEADDEVRRLAGAETWREWRRVIHDAENTPAEPLSHVAELITLQQAMRKADDLMPADRQRIARRIAELIALAAEEDTRRRWREVVEADPLADAAAKAERTLEYYAVLSLFHEFTENLRSAFHRDPVPEEWQALARECRSVIHSVDIGDLNHAAPILLRMRLLEGLAHLEVSRIYFQQKATQKHLLHYERGVNLLELVLCVDPDRFPAALAIPARSDSAIGGAGLIFEDPGGNRQPVSIREKAQYVLADYCPWGVGVYELLRDTGLTKALEWRILPPYGGDDVVQVGPVVLLSKELTPACMRAFAEDIARGKLPHGDRLTVKWRRPPKLSCSVCFLSRAAFAWKTSDIVGLFWKAFVFLTAGPGPLIEDAVQDYVVSEVGSVSSDDEPIYATIARINDADNWGFDKSFLWKGKLEVKHAKLLKSFLVYVLQMNEGTALARFFSGRVPPLADMQRSTLDARSYDRRPIAYVFLRADVHGLADIGRDEYVRIWDFTRYMVLEPRHVAGADVTYNLSDEVYRELGRGAQYRAGDVGVQKRTWAEMGSLKELWGFRRNLIDFSPMVQVLKMDIADDAWEEWLEIAEADEVYVALLRYATGKREVVPGSAHEIHKSEVTWRLEDTRRRKMIDERNRPGRITAGLPPEHFPEWKADKVVQIDVPRKEYVLDIIRYRIAGQKPVWEHAVAKMLSVPVRFLEAEGGATGKVHEFAPGFRYLAQDLEWEGTPKGPPAWPFEHCHVKFNLRFQTEDEQGTRMRQHDIQFVANGKFKGNTFTGTFKRDESRTNFTDVTNGSITVTLRPPSREVGGVKFSEKIESFGIEVHEHRVKREQDGSTFGNKRDWTMTGLGLRLVEDSGILHLHQPLAPIFENQRLRMRYGYAMIGYEGHTDDGKSNVAVTFSRKATWSGGQRNERKSGDATWEGAITFGF